MSTRQISYEAFVCARNRSLRE